MAEDNASKTSLSEERIYEISKNTVAGERALEPFRGRLRDLIVEVADVQAEASKIVAAMGTARIEKDPDIPEWPDPAINYACELVRDAAEPVAEAKDFLTRAADLDAKEVYRTWTERLQQSEAPGA